MEPKTDLVVRWRTKLEAQDAGPYDVDELVRKRRAAARWNLKLALAHLSRVINRRNHGIDGKTNRIG
jgi:hypothetical protein